MDTDAQVEEMMKGDKSEMGKRPLDCVGQLTSKSIRRFSAASKSGGEEAARVRMLQSLDKNKWSQARAYEIPSGLLIWLGALIQEGSEREIHA
ncbi:MAG: hypothetical protein Q9216_003006 [Gyalolechia sp. 2 TL-2023]